MSSLNRPSTSVSEKTYSEKIKEIPKIEQQTKAEKFVNQKNSNNNYETNAQKKGSMIPRPKIEKSGRKKFQPPTVNNSTSSSSSSSPVKKKDVCKKNYAKKKESSDLQLDATDLIPKVSKERAKRFYSYKCKEENRPKSSSTLKMMSAPSLNINKNEDFMKLIETDFNEIVSVLMNTTSDIYNTMKNIKNCASVNPQILGKKMKKIQMVKDKLKFLSFLTTKNDLEEAKQLVANKGYIRNEILKVLNSSKNNKKELLEGETKFSKELNLKKKNDLKNLRSCPCDIFQMSKIDETGDSTKRQTDVKTNGNKENLEIISTELERTGENFKGNKEIKQNSKVNEEELEKVKQNISSDTINQSKSEDLPEQVKTLTLKLKEKTETIKQLNWKLFELHQAFEENTSKYNDLQNKLGELCKNLHWNYILWKEIGKLKNQIKLLEQNKREEKKELKSNKKNLDEEIINLTNHVLSQQLSCNSSKNLLEFCSCEFKENCSDDEDQNSNNTFKNIEETMLQNKQIVINQLLALMKAMKDQENVAHKQKEKFLAKLNELQKFQNS